MIQFVLQCLSMMTTMRMTTNTFRPWQESTVNCSVPCLCLSTFGATWTKPQNFPPNHCYEQQRPKYGQMVRFPKEQIRKRTEESLRTVLGKVESELFIQITVGRASLSWVKWSQALSELFITQWRKSIIVCRLCPTLSREQCKQLHQLQAGHCEANQYESVFKCGNKKLA